MRDFVHKLFTIEVGDKVWAYDIFTDKTELKEVTKGYVHEVDEILHLHTSCGDIDTTTNHPFYVLDRGWVAAGDLAAGDEILTLDGSVAVITGSEIEKLGETILVYNLEVADFNTYFVGDVPVLVHNYNKHDEYYNQANDPELKGLIDELYRPSTEIGYGGTADMLRYEYDSGIPLKHLQKAQDRIRQLNNMLTRKLFDDGDRKLMYHFLGDLFEAIKYTGNSAR